jgi:hypothetical protein
MRRHTWQACAMSNPIRYLRRQSGNRVSLLRHRGGVSATTAAVAAGVAILASVLVAAASSAPGRVRLVYQNPSLPVQARVSDLLSRMTLAEKVGQMVQIEATQVTDRSNSCTSRAASTCPTRCLSRRFLSTTTWLDPGRRDGYPPGHDRPRWDRQHRSGLGPTSTTRCSPTRSRTRGCTSRSSSASTRCTVSGTGPRGSVRLVEASLGVVALESFGSRHGENESSRRDAGSKPIRPARSLADACAVVSVCWSYELGPTDARSRASRAGPAPRGILR